MTAIEKIRKKLEKYPALRHSTAGNTITLEAVTDEGFSVWLTEHGQGCTVGFDGWHEEFENDDDALNAFAFGLSDECRLKVIQRGDTDCAWTVEGKEDGQWKGDSTTGLLLIPFWRKRKIVFRQNRIITGGKQAEDPG